LSLRLTKLQKQLCNLLQEGLPISWRPFADLAETLNSDETEILQQTKRLKELGVIRRFCALLNHRALGVASTLVAAHVPQENLRQVVGAVNRLENVSHNYQRNHHYNLWFTLQAETAAQIELALTNLSARFGIDFHSLPVRRAFKLDVRFDAESEAAAQSEILQDVEKIPKGEPAKLDESEKRVLSQLQKDLDLTANPFDFLCSGGLEKEDALRIIKDLIEKGVIQRIAAVVDHCKLGFVANVLFAAEVGQDRVVQAGKRLARFAIVTHCYERQTFENWPYNLFAMMHGRSIRQIQHVINKFAEAEKIDSFQLLPTVSELKKQPVRYKFY